MTNVMDGIISGRPALDVPYNGGGGGGVSGPGFGTEPDTGTPSSGSPTPGAPDPTDQQRGAFAIIRSALEMMNLGSLADKVWDWVKGGQSEEEIWLNIRNTPEHAVRFPAYQTLARRGRAISEGAIVEFERQSIQMWHAAGLPVEQIDQGGFITKWLEGEVSLNELSHRIGTLYTRVAATAPEVRNWYQSVFGYEGDAMIAASFADPESAVPVLEQRVAAAEFGGAGARFGFGIGLDRALEAAGVGVNAGQAQQGFQQLDEMRGIFDETISESDDLTVEDEGIGGVFGLDPGASRDLRRRGQQRQAQFAGSSQAGGLQTNQGLGLGRARANQQ